VCLRGALERRVVEDAPACAREPAGREPPARSYASGPLLNAKHDGDRDGDQRPEDVDGRDEDEEARAFPTGCGACSPRRPILGAAGRPEVVEHQPEQDDSEDQGQRGADDLLRGPGA